VLRLDGLRKAYGVGTPLEVEVLHGIDLTLQGGEFAALIGPSVRARAPCSTSSACSTRPPAAKFMCRAVPPWI
jgi:ABC-type antimicrobial peptide transport system, ATPase component